MAREKVKIGKNGQVLVRRFTPLQQVEHWSMAACFILLVLTGFPQKFETSQLGHAIIAMFGGIDNARIIHRVVGIIMSVQGGLHIVNIAIGALTGKMRMTLMPTTQDIYDAWSMLRYYLAKQKEKPPLPKFDYRQKFEYLGMVLGSLVMIFSGLALLFPVLVIRYLPLPGEIIMVAQVLHSSEAMLALFVLLVWHVYGASLNPEVFPLDRSMFTGYMTAEELHHHHRLEWEYVFGDEENPPGAHHGSGGHGAHSEPAPTPPREPGAPAPATSN